MFTNVVLFVMFCVFIYLLDYPEGDNFKIARAPRTRRSSRSMGVGLSRTRRRRYPDPHTSGSRSYVSSGKSVKYNGSSRVPCSNTISAPEQAAMVSREKAVASPPHTRSMLVTGAPPPVVSQPSLATRVLLHSPPLLSCATRYATPSSPTSPSPPPQPPPLPPMVTQPSSEPISLPSSQAPSAESFLTEKPTSARLQRRPLSRGAMGDSSVRKASVAATLATAVRCLEEQRADHRADHRRCYSFDETSA